MESERVTQLATYVDIKLKQKLVDKQCNIYR